jgi:chromosome segregation ATPase
VLADGGSAGAISGPPQLKGLKKETVEGRRKGRTLERDIRSIKTRLAAVEAQIHELEVRLEDIGLSLADPDLYRDGQRARDIAQARRDTEERVAWLMKEWEDLSVRLSEASGEPR